MKLGLARASLLSGLALFALASPAAAHDDPKLHAAIDGDVATLQAAAQSGAWQRCIDLAAEGQALAAGHDAFEQERLARRETLSELAAAADAAGAAHRAAVAAEGPASDLARSTRDAWERAIAEHQAEGAAYDELLRPRNEAVHAYEDHRAELAPVCGPLEAAETRWLAARARLDPWCEEYGQQLRRIAAGQVLSRLDDPDAKARAQAGIDRELARHNCLHPVKALEYERAVAAPAAPTD